MVSFFLSIAAAALYTIAAVRLIMSLDQRHAIGASTETSAPARRTTTLGLATIAMLLHGWVAMALTGLPATLNLPFFTALAVTALVIVLLQLALCLRQPADYLGLGIYPVAAITLMASQISTEASAAPDLSIQIHVLLSVLAYGLLSLAAAQAVLVAVQRHFLNNHKPGGFLRVLPPYESTENLLFLLLTTGFLLLTLSLASGFFYLEDMFAQHLVHKTVLSCLAWALFGTLLFGRWQFGWRGRRAVYWTLGGFGLLIVAYFGSKLVLELILHRT